MIESKKITWPQMLNLRTKDFSPFTLEFELVRPVDSKGVIAFATLKVKGFKGTKTTAPKALVECDGEEWYAVSAETVLVSAK